MLALGGFALVGLFGLGVAVIAAVVLRLTVRDSTVTTNATPRSPYPR